MGSKGYVFLGMFIVLLLVGCEEKVEPGKVERNRLPIRGLGVMSVRLETTPHMYEAVGTVRAKNTSILASKISGTITGVNVKEGNRVTKGDLLLTIDDREIVAKIESAQRNLVGAKAQELLASDTYHRYLKLYNEQVVTKQEFQTVETDYKVVKQKVNQIQAEIRGLEALLTYTRPSAPTDGLITRRHVDVGTVVTPGMPLLTVEDVKSGYRLEVSVGENMIKRVRLGEEVKITVDALGSETFSGEVSEITPMTDPFSRSFVVKIDVNIPDIHSGMYGKAIFPMEPHEALLIPKEAILERGQLSGVYVIDKEGIVRFRLIKTGRTFKNRIEVISGLSPGETIIVSGLDAVIEGGRIEK